MSESDPIPPPLPTLTQASAAAPKPVLPLSVTPPIRFPVRPGVLSAIGVISILVACLSALASLMGGCQTGVAYMTSRVARTMRSSSSATAASAAPVVATPQGTPATNPSDSDGTAEATTQAVGTNRLTATEISGAVQRAQKAAGNKLSTAQINALTTALQDPDQTLVAPGTAWSPVRIATVNADGSAYVYFSGGLIMFDAQGQVTSVTPMNKAPPTLNINTTTFLLAGLDAILSFLLAIFLFISAIAVTRNAPSGRRLHLIYAIAKIPLAIGGGYMLATVIAEFLGGIGGQVAAGGPSMIRNVFVIFVILICGGGLIYPIALLIAMNTRGVRDFYSAVN